MVFSIIIPAKNEGENVVLCLESLRNLNYASTEYEILLIDNGSTDDTVSLAKALGANVYVQPDLTLSGLRNYGATKAQGSILCFLDADCIVDVDWLQNAANAMEDQRVGCTGSTPYGLPNSSWVESVWSSFRTRRRTPCRATWINSSNLFVRKKLFERVGGFDEQLVTCEDVDISLRLSTICTVLFDPSIKACHLREPKSVIEFFRKELWRGKGNLRGAISHGFVLNEMKSLMVPLYYLFLNAVIMFMILFQQMSLSTFKIAVLGYVFPVIVFSIWAAKVTCKWSYIPGFCILFLAYANARACALLHL